MQVKKFGDSFASVMVRICRPGGRSGFPTQRPLRGTLPQTKSFNLLAFAACLSALSGCEIFGGADSGTGPVESEYADSSNFTISVVERSNISESSGSNISEVHFFIYDGEELKMLEREWTESSNPGTVSFRSSKKDKIVVAIANCPRRLDISKLARFEAIEQLRILFMDDDNVTPVMSGCCTVSPAITAELVLRPLMGRVVLEEVSNNMTGYKRLEDPRIYLKGASESVEVLRNDGFHTSEFLSDTIVRANLPCDVGMFTQHPCTELFCYPDDSPDGITLVLECEIKGKTRSFEHTVSPIGRNSTKRVDFTIDSEDSCSWKVY